MNSRDLLEELNTAIFKSDVSAINEIFLEDPNLLRANGKINELLIEFRFDDTYENPLAVALKVGNVKVIELLLKNGVRLDGPAWKGNSPAEVVLDRSNNVDNRKEILRLLFEYGLDAKFHKEFGDNLLHIFIDNVREEDPDVLEIVDLLAKAGVPEADIDEWSWTLLHGAVQSQNIQLISYFIKKGADTSNRKLLDFALHKSNLAILDLLLSNGADIEDRNFRGSTLLHEACWNHKVQVISFLIRKGADISALNDKDRTPISILLRKDCYSESCLIAMVKGFARLSFENNFICGKDLALLQENYKTRKHFELCKKELAQMTSTEFHTPYTFYSMLKMSISVEKLVNLTKNKYLISKFEQSLKKFSYYANDLQTIWKQATDIRDEAEEIYSRLYSIFRNLFPQLVIRKISKNLTLKDLPLE